MIEEAVTARELEVGVIGNARPRASVPGEIVPTHEFYDYEDKYLDGAAEMVIPADLPNEVAKEIQDLAIRSFKALRCDGLARVDFFYEEDGRGLLLNEVNTMPGFTPLLDVPVAVGRHRPPLRRADRRAGPPRPGAPRPSDTAPHGRSLTLPPRRAPGRSPPPSTVRLDAPGAQRGDAGCTGVSGRAARHAGSRAARDDDVGGRPRSARRRGRAAPAPRWPDRRPSPPLPAGRLDRARGRPRRPPAR